MGCMLFDKDKKEDEHNGNKEEDKVGKEKNFGEEKDSNNFHDTTQGCEDTGKTCAGVTPLCHLAKAEKLALVQAQWSKSKNVTQGCDDTGDTCASIAPHCHLTKAENLVMVQAQWCKSNMKQCCMHTLWLSLVVLLVAWFMIHQVGAHLKLQHFSHCFWG